MTKTYTEIITRLLKGKLTSYRIGKDTGIPIQYIDKIRNGETKVENIGLGKAEILVAYANQKRATSVNKSQWLNLAREVNSLEEAKEFLGNYVFGYSSKESALNSFKHEIKKDYNLGRSLKGERVPLGEKPEDLIPWLAELSVNDIAER